VSRWLLRMTIVTFVSGALRVVLSSSSGRACFAFPFVRARLSLICSGREQMRNILRREIVGGDSRMLSIYFFAMTHSRNLQVEWSCLRTYATSSIAFGNATSYRCRNCRPLARLSTLWLQRQRRSVHPVHSTQPWLRCST